VGEDEALRRLNEVLARPEFGSHSATTQLQEMLAYLWLSLMGLLDEIFRESSLTGVAINLSVIVLSVLLLVGGVIFLVRTVRRTVGRDDEMQGMSLAERRERSDQLWRRAQELAAAGQLRDAARLAYLSALYALDERALLHVEAGLTNREHAHRLQATHPQVAETFATLVQVYDALRYSGAAVTLEGFRELSGLVARARSSALG
jgi:uncharacterized protein DUF4129